MLVPSKLLSQLFVRKICAFAGNTLLVYDYLLTLSMEVEYVWNAPWTLVKILFLINRYGNLFGQTIITLEEMGILSHGSQKFCIAFQMYYSAFGVFSGESVRLLVVMRACAILRCSRSLALVLKMFYLLYALGMLVLLNYLLSRAHPYFQYLSQAGVCFTPIPPQIWKIWFILLSFDGIILVIVSHNLYRLTKGCHGMHPSRLISLLIRDTLLFYFATLYNVVLCMICWGVFNLDPRNFIVVLITCPVISVTGQRLILNLRRFRSQPESARHLEPMVNREIAEVHGEQWHHQSGYPWDQTSSGMIQMVGLHSNRRCEERGGAALKRDMRETDDVGDETNKPSGLHPVSL